MASSACLMPLSKQSGDAPLLPTTSRAYSRQRAPNVPAWRLAQRRAPHLAATPARDAQAPTSCTRPPCSPRGVGSKHSKVSCCTGGLGAQALPYQPAASVTENPGFGPSPAVSCWQTPQSLPSCRAMRVVPVPRMRLDEKKVRNKI